MSAAAESVRAAFLADIIAAPQDDAVRLIYADWLEGLCTLFPATHTINVQAGE